MYLVIKRKTINSSPWQRVILMKVDSVSQPSPWDLNEDREADVSLSTTPPSLKRPFLPVSTFINVPSWWLSTWLNKTQHICTGFWWYHGDKLVDKFFALKPYFFLLFWIVDICCTSSEQKADHAERYRLS